MNTGKAVYGILSTNSGVTDLVGTRIFPEIAEQEAATPFIVYQLQSVAPEDTHDGPSKLDEVRFEFICYADTYDQAADVGVKVRAALDRVSGTYNGVNVESVQFNDVDINIEYDPRRYSQVLTFTFRIKRDDFTIAQGTPVTGAQLGQLADVDVDGVSNGQLIAYNSTSGNWEAADDAGGAERLNDLQDVNFSGIPEDRNVLMYDGEEWVEDNVSKSDVGLGNVDNTSDADKPVSSATQTALNAKADTSAVPTELNDLSDVTITGTPAGNEALIFDTATSSFKSLPNFTNRFEDEAENNVPATPFSERVYTVKADGDGIFIDAQSDTPTAGKVIERKIYHKAGFLESGDVIGDFTLIHTFADDTAYSATESVFEGFRDGDTYGSPPFTLIQTWEEATAAPAFTGLLNESYGSGAAAAYSVRRLNGNYTGAAIEVERTSDGTYQDIGFDVNGDLDESALTTFCTGTTCKVSKWYDQSQTGGTGSGLDAEQADDTKQPTIYTGGAIVKENGRVAVDFDGSNDVLLSALGWSTTDKTINIVAKPTATNNYFFGILNDSGGSRARFYLFSEATANTSRFVIGNPAVNNEITTSQTQQLYYMDYASSNHAFDFAINGSAVNSTTGNAINPSGVGYMIGGINNGNDTAFDTGAGLFQEVIIYDTDKSTDRTSIESNIADYYTQNTPLLDTYTGAAAAYSLRKLRTAYTGDAIRVRRSSDNAETDIGFNVFGELDTVSLAAHCGSNDGFVKTWYDQASSNDATQTTTADQPKIYDGTTGVVTENGKPAVQMSSNSIKLAVPSSKSTFKFLHDGSNSSTTWVVSPTDARETSGTTDHELFETGEFTSSVGVEITYRSSQFSGTENAEFEVKNGSSKSVDFRTSNGAFNVGQNLCTFFIDADNSTAADRLKVGLNGNTLQTGNTKTAAPSTADSQLDFTIYGGFTAHWQEIVVWNSDQSSNRTGIESNINTFYSIY